MLSKKQNRENRQLAKQLGYIAKLLNYREGGSYRSKAYSRASKFVDKYPNSLCAIDSAKEISHLKSIGMVIADQIIDYCHHEKITYLEDLLNAASPEQILALAPEINLDRAREIVDLLSIKSYFDLLSAYEKGNLARLLGKDSKSFQEISELLESLPGWLFVKKVNEKLLPELPAVRDLLRLDRKFRESNLSPNNSDLPMRVKSRKGVYEISFSKSNSAFQRGAIGDWVTITLIFDGHSLKWTVLTSRFGVLKGRRVVMGRLAECRKYYSKLDRSLHAA